MYVRALLWEEGKGQESFPVSGKAFGAFPGKERLRRKKGGVSRREAAVSSVPGITILRRGRARGELCRGTGGAAPSPGPSDGGWRGSPQHSLPGRGRPSRHDALRSEPRGTGVPAPADSRRTHTLPACAGAEPPEPRKRRRTASQCLSSEFQNYFVEMCSIMFAFVQGNPIPLRQS